MAQVTRPTRRARSANHVSHVMEDKLDRALVAGTQPTTDGRNMRVRISLGPRKQVVLIESDGTVTTEGKYVYDKIGIEPPRIYDYGQPLVNGKWVKNFEWAKSKWTRVVDKNGKPTPRGENYFKYNKDEYYVQFPVRKARPKNPNSDDYKLDRTSFEYIERDWRKIPIRSLTVGELKTNA